MKDGWRGRLCFFGEGGGKIVLTGGHLMSSFHRGFLYFDRHETNLNQWPNGLVPGLTLTISKSFHAKMFGYVLHIIHLPK